MKIRLTYVAFAFVAAIAFVSAEQSDGARTLMEAARKKEVVDGDLKAAIQQYQTIVDKYKSDRAVVADALVRMAECYQKLGDAQAKQIFDRVVREYGDQREAAAIARTRLDGGFRASATTAQSIRQIWTGPGADQAESISRDGRYVSYGDWSDGLLGEISVRDLTTGSNKRLTSHGQSGAAFGTVISPDGRQVAYGYSDCRTPTCAMGEVRLVPTSGGTPKTIHRSEETANIVPAGWMPDGRHLVVMRTLRDRSTQMAILSVGDGSLRVLKSFGWQSTGKVSVSPDGRYVAYDAPGSDNVPAHDIYVLATDGSRESKAVDNPAIDWGAVWSPDGSRILFLSDRTGSASVWSVSLEHGTAAGQPDLLKPDVGFVNFLGMTREGALYYVSEFWGRRNVYVAGVDANMPTGAPKLASEGFVNVSAGPSWSPDGQSLAYYALLAPTRAMTGVTRLVIRTVANGTQREIRMPRLRIPPYGFVAPPRWFPDGRSVLVASYESQRPVLGFYRVDVGSGQAELLHSTRSQVGPGLGKFALSPDAKSIFYIDLDEPKPRETVPQLMRFDLDARRAVELKRGLPFQDVAVSPDGKELAIATSDYADKSIALLVMPAGGGEPRVVYRSRGGTNVFGLAWSPDGRFLVFPRSTGAGAQDVWRVAVVGGDARTMGVGTDDVFFPSIRPDGRAMTFASRASTWQAVWSLENILPAKATSR
jgi:Tol biopolymer transport system component